MVDIKEELTEALNVIRVLEKYSSKVEGASLEAALTIDGKRVATFFEDEDGWGMIQTPRSSDTEVRDSYDHGIYSPGSR